MLTKGPLDTILDTLRAPFWKIVDKISEQNLIRHESLTKRSCLQPNRLSKRCPEGPRWFATDLLSLKLR